MGGATGVVPDEAPEDLVSERVRESFASSVVFLRSVDDVERSLLLVPFVSFSVALSRLDELFEELSLLPEPSRLGRPMEVSPAGTSVAPAGIELSYSWLSRSMAARIEALTSMSSVLATVWRSFMMSGIQ